MTIYDKPTKTLMAEWARDNLEPGTYFTKQQPVEWFKAHYPEIKPNTVEMHVEGMSVNNPVRRHHRSVRAGSGHDLFFKEGPGRFRLWDPERDPAARYKAEFEQEEKRNPAISMEGEEADAEEAAGSETFAYERDLRNYLERNLHLLEPGLQLYEEEGLTGIEFNAGGRRIDILAVDRTGTLVIIELKVSRGYDRAIGQLLRYMGWIEAHLTDGKPVRGIIVANEISEDLLLATHHFADSVKLFQYQLSFRIQQIER